eukprot:8628239-Ditylum_brightwellii.AAC.1
MIASQQADATEATMKACHHLLDYVATHPNATIRYLASNMMLVVHSDASYLSEQKAHSRAAAHFYLANKTNEDLNNGAILTLSSIICHGGSSTPVHHTGGNGAPPAKNSTHHQ